MNRHTSIISTDFTSTSTALSETWLTLSQAPFVRSSGDILSLAAIAQLNGWEWIPVVGGGTAMSSNFDEVVAAYYVQCGKNVDGSISTVVYVNKAPSDLSYKLVTNSGEFTGKILDNVSKEQSVSFNLTTAEDLGFVPTEVVSVEWDGDIYNSDGSKIILQAPRVSGSHLVATQPVLGTARINYKVLSDIWDLTVPMRDDKTYQATVIAFYNGQATNMDVSFPNLSDLCSESPTLCLGDCETAYAGASSTTTVNTSGVVDPYPGADAPGGDYGNLKSVDISLDPDGDGCDVKIEIELEPGCPTGTIDLEWDDDLSPDSIVPGTSADIFIKNGYPPYLWEIVNGYGYTLEYPETASFRNTLIASASACGNAEIEVVDECATEITGVVNGPDTDLEWDWVNSGDTVAANSNVTVFVLGGSPPFSWSISGTDFSIHNPASYARKAVVYTGPHACGSGTITVIDACGDTCTGSVRCTAGQWVVIEDTALGDDACGIMRGVGRDYWYWGHAPFHGDSWRGKYWLREEYGRIGYGWPYPGWCDECKAATYGQGFVSCLLGRIPTCKETYPWADPGAGPCCYCSHGYCHYMGNRKLYEWKCP